MSIQSLALKVTTGTPPTQVIHTQVIPLEIIQQPGSKSVPITDAGMLAAINTQPAGTIFTPSIIANYNDPNLGEGEGTIIVSTTSVQNFVPNKITPTLSLGSISNKLATDIPFQLVVTSPSDGIKTYSSSNTSVAEVNSSGLVTLKGIEGTITINVSQAASTNGVYTAATSVSTQLVVLAPPTPLITRASNNTTIQYTDPDPLASEPRFIQADPRNTGTPEWFAVVTDASKAQITSYAKNEQNGINYFTKSGHSQPVIFNNIVTTRMTDMSFMFNNVIEFNGDISSWDVSNVTNMFMMFIAARAFNKNIGAWNTSKVISMAYMFSQARAFDQPIGEWDTSKVETMFGMFYEASAFNNGGTPNIYFLNTSSVTNMDYMFNNATSFNKNISAWNVTLVTPKPPNDFRTGSALTAANMPVWFPLLTRAANNVTIQYTQTSIGSSEPAFIYADPRKTGSQEWFAVVTDASTAQITSYAKNEAAGISYFTTSGQLVPFKNIVTTLMTDMNNMFNDAMTFNQDISSWDTSNVTSMYAMFIFALAFNKNIDAWNTTLVTNMDRMFYYAAAFNQPIGSWDTSNVENMYGMFQNASAFNQNIGSWNTAKVTNMINTFSSASAFNQNISGWDVALTPARPSLSRTDFATGSPLALAENSHKLPLFQ